MSIRRVGVLFDTVGVFGRGVFHGVTRYGLLGRHWQLSEPPLYAPWHPIGWETWPVDGYVAQIADHSMRKSLAERGLPVVNVSGRLLEMSFPSVMVDDVAAGRVAADHLLDRGFRSFGCMGWSETAFGTLRVEGFCTRIREAGFDCAVCDVTSPAEDHSGWLRTLAKPVGILACSDWCGVLLLRECRDLGIAVPEQAAVVAVDDDELFRELGGVSLSSVQTPGEEIGYQAAALLDALMDGAVPPDRPMLLPPGRVMVRQSSEILAIHDPEVAQAVRFIREHSREAIGVEEVLQQVLIGRRSLERRFREALGRTLLEEITRVRINDVQRLLTETDLPMHQIARRSGFSNPTYMAAVFRQQTGLSPRAYRKQFARGRRSSP